MSYRKINVDGKVYQYVIGKTHLKIRDLITMKKEDIGVGFRGEHIITPGMVADYIRHGKVENKEKYFHHCKHNKPKQLCYKPFEKEIYGKSILVYWCDDCIDNSVMAI